MKKVLLVDGMAIVYRAHFAFQKYPRRNSRGMNTSAVFGFATTLLEALQKEKPTHRGVIFDTEVPTFRHKIYPEYKAHREKQPEDISEGLPWVRKLLGALRIPVISLDGYEADDIIGTLARAAAEEGCEVLIMSPDKDFAQLLSEHIYLYKPPFMKKPAQRIGIEALQVAYGVDRPEQIIDLLALQGDSVDNIPGVPGIGTKTAQSLLAEHDSLDQILKLPEGLSPSVLKKLAAHKEQALLSRKLATIDTKVPLRWQADTFLNQHYDTSALREVFSFLEFKTLAKRLLGEDLPLYRAKAAATASPLFGQEGQQATAPTEEASDDFSSSELRPLPQESQKPTPQYLFLRTVADCEALLPYLLEQKRVAWVLQAAHERPLRPQLQALALAYVPEEAYVLLLPKEKSEAQALLRIFMPFFENTTVEKVCADAKEELRKLQAYGMALQGPFFDIILAHYLHNSEANHALEALVAQYLPAAEQPALGTDPPLGLPAAQQATQLLSLRALLKKELQVGRLQEVYQDLELPLIEILAEMEKKGVLLAPEALEQLSKSYAREAEILQKEIYVLAGESFNISSPKQLGAILFDKLKLQEKPKKTKTGHYATGEEILQSLAEEQPIAKKVLAFREYQKLRSTYLEALPRFIAEDGRIHTQYRQAVAATGRLSANHPNLQNIPIRSEKGQRIRKAFVAAPGCRLISADYSQIELRILAAFAKDKAMLAAFAEEEDIHRATARKIFNIPAAEVDAQQRRAAKSANFGIIYGISAFGLSQRLHIPRKAAQALIDSYFATFPQVKNYISEQQQRARTQGYVETYYGRRRHLPDINSRNATARAFAERNAINAPIQGTAADIIKRAMCQIAQWLKEEKLKTALILQIHDELLFETPIEEVPQLQQALPSLMQGASELSVPMQISVGVGNNWLEAH